MGERRTAHRVQVNLPARYSSDAIALSGWIANLSPEGLFMRSEYLDEAGADVTVSFDLPGDPQPVDLRGEVVRVHDSPLCPGMAVRFVQVPDAARRKLDAFMQKRFRFPTHP